MTGRVSLPAGTKAPMGEGAATACCVTKASAEARTGKSVSLSMILILGFDSSCDNIVNSEYQARGQGRGGRRGPSCFTDVATGVKS